MCSLVVQFVWLVERHTRLMLDDRPQYHYQYGLKLEQDTVKKESFHLSY
jgi:hypothetical protein